MLMQSEFLKNLPDYSVTSYLDSILVELIHNKANSARYQLDLTRFGFSKIKVIKGIGERNGELEYLDDQIEQLINEEMKEFVVVSTRDIRSLRFTPDRYYPSAICAFPLIYSSEFVGCIWSAYKQFAEIDDFLKQQLAQMFRELSVKFPAILDISISNLNSISYEVLFQNSDIPIFIWHDKKLILKNEASKSFLLNHSMAEMEIIEQLSNPNKTKSTMLKQIQFEGKTYQLVSESFYCELIGEAETFMLIDITGDTALKRDLRNRLTTTADRLQKYLTASEEKLNLLHLVGNLNDNQKTIIDEVIQEIDTATDFVESVLNVEKTSKGNLEFDTVNLFEIVDGAIKELSNLILQRRVDIDVSSIGIWPTIKCVPEFMNLSIFNILEFLVKTSQIKGKVQINTSISEQKITIELENVGAGINAIDLDHAWDEIYYFTSEIIGGIKDNQSILVAKRAIEHQQGELILESQPGKGIKFTIVLVQG